MQIRAIFRKRTGMMEKLSSFFSMGMWKVFRHRNWFRSIGRGIIRTFPNGFGGIRFISESAVEKTNSAIGLKFAGDDRASFRTRIDREDRADQIRTVLHRLHSDAGPASLLIGKRKTVVFDRH